MIALATGKPTFAIDGERIILSVPSGKDKLQIAMTLNEALFIDYDVRRIIVAFYEQRQPPTAEVITLATRAGRG